MVFNVSVNMWISSTGGVFPPLLNSIIKNDWNEEGCRKKSRKCEISQKIMVKILFKSFDHLSTGHDFL